MLTMNARLVDVMKEQRMETVLTRLKEISEGDENFAREVAESFLEAAPGCLTLIDEAISCADGRKLAAAAHGLKGISLTIGADNLATSCQTLEDAGRRGDFRELQAEFARAGRAWEQVRAELKPIADLETSRAVRDCLGWGGDDA
jgi:HPt (histidine-containing phosphotransfer) domain-containing protein